MVKLTLNQTVNGDSLKPETTYKLENGEEVQVSRLQYYLSGFAFVHDGGQVTHDSSLFLLVDALQDVEFVLGNYDIDTLEQIRFSVGVYAPVNNEDPAQWSFEHPLAPKSPSMHWGWVSGYRFVCFEGYTGSAFDTKWEFHALGNDYYYPIGIAVDVAAEEGMLDVQLEADYGKALESISVADGPITHGEFADNIQLLQNFRDNVYESPSGNRNTLDKQKMLTTASFSLFPNPSKGTVFLSWEGDQPVSMVRVYNLQGQIVRELAVNNRFALRVNDLRAGAYLVQLVSEERETMIMTQKLLVE